VGDIMQTVLITPFLVPSVTFTKFNIVVFRISFLFGSGGGDDLKFGLQ